MASEPVYEEKNNGLWWLLLALAGLGLLFFVLLPLLNDDDDVDLIDDDIDITEDVDNDFDDDLFDDDVTVITPVIGDTLTNSTVVVEEVISDRLFRISGVDFPPAGVLMYLDDSLDLGEMETEIDVDEGDRLVLDGEYRADLDNQTLEPDESNTVNVEGIVFVVTDLEMI